MKSKQISNIEVSSSGIEAWKNLNGPVCTYTTHVLTKENIIQFMKPGWTVSNKEGIDQQDLVIFMEKMHYDFCLEELHCHLPKYEIWDIEDLPEMPNYEYATEEAKNIRAEETFEKIKSKVDVLIPVLEK